ncbi:MAG: S41 family peptidase [Aerococcaceae bacterium]|nr:S41 family peptidase [Aerococcaceae bacterium]
MKSWQKISLLATTALLAFAPVSRVVAEELTQEDLQLLQDVYNSIQSNYIEEVDKKTLLEGALKGMVNSVGDQYSEYFDAETAASFEEDMSASFEGIGVQFAIKNGEPVVISPIDGTPASKAGLQPNDVFVKVGDELLKDKTSQEVVKLIRGPKGSEVTLTIRRGESLFDVTLVRDTIPNHSVTGELDKENAEIGYVKITQFAQETAKELQETIQSLREKGAKRFIFDVRSNPGGLLDQAMKITNMFSEDGDVMMQVQERSGDAQKYYANGLFGTFKVTEPYVVLIDDGSASASEIFAAVVSENTDNPLVGVKTFGKGTVQNITNQSELGELKLTIAKWLTPNGEWIHEKGIEPDVVVERLPVEKAVLLDTKAELKKGQSTETTASLALMLNTLGYTVKSDSYFDDEMEAQVKAFQKANGFEETGVVTGETAQKLMDDVRAYVTENDVQYQKAKELVLKAE